MTIATVLVPVVDAPFVVDMVRPIGAGRIATLSAILYTPGSTRTVAADVVLDENGRVGVGQFGEDALRALVATVRAGHVADIFLGVSASADAPEQAAAWVAAGGRLRPRSATEIAAFTWFGDKADPIRFVDAWPVQL